MRLIGREKLASLKGIGNEIEKWVLSWTAEVTNAHWKRPADVCSQFHNAKDKGNGNFLFPVGNCDMAIQLLVAFPQGIALITALKASEDTHEH